MAMIVTDLDTGETYEDALARELDDRWWDGVAWALVQLLPVAVARWLAEQPWCPSWLAPLLIGRELDRRPHRVRIVAA